MPLFLYPREISATPGDGKLYEGFLSLFSTPGRSNGLYLSVIAFGLLYVQSLLINYLVNEQRMTNRQTFLPAMSYLLITSLIPQWNYLSSTLVATTITIWIFIKVFKLYNAGNASGAIFNIGLLLGINSFLFFPSLGFILPVLLGLMILRPFKFNEFVLLLLGITTPYYFYIVYLFLRDQLVLSSILPQFSIQLPLMHSELWVAIAIIFLGAPFIIGGYHIQTHLRKMLIQARKNWSILLLYLFLSLLIPFVNSHASINKWVVVAAPFAAFHTCAYLYPRRQLVPLVLFFLTISFILVQQYGTPFWKN
jgi:hypothetical protein